MHVYKVPGKLLHCILNGVGRKFPKTLKQYTSGNVPWPALPVEFVLVLPVPSPSVEAVLWLCSIGPGENELSLDLLPVRLQNEKRIRLLLQS